MGGKKIETSNMHSGGQDVQLLYAGKEGARVKMWLRGAHASQTFSSQSEKYKKRKKGKKKSDPRLPLSFYTSVYKNGAASTTAAAAVVAVRLVAAWIGGGA